MTIADIPLGSGLRRLVDGYIDEVRLGVRRFWSGGIHRNAPADESTSLVNRLIRLLRYAFVILAAHLELAPVRPRASARRPSSRARPVRKPVFPLTARCRIAVDDTPPGPVPPAFARAAQTPRDRFLTVRRKLDALARALADPLPFVRRLARRLATHLMVFGWRPPKRPPPTDRREYWDSLLCAFAEARYALSEWRRRRRDSAATASGS
jgi:hypothetical protein